MTRAQGIRSSKRKLVKSSQDTIPEYCKENSPSILSQNSRRAAQTKKKFDDCKENTPSVLSQNSKRAAQARNEFDDCKENSPSILGQNSARAAEGKKKFDVCKENTPSILCQNSKRAVQARNKFDDCKKISPSTLSQNSTRAAQGKKKFDDCKENSPYNFSQNPRRVGQAEKKTDGCKENYPSKLNQHSRRAAQAKRKPDDCKGNIPSLIQSSRRAAQAGKNSDDCKENISPEGLSKGSKLTPIANNKEIYSPIRKSRRHPNATVPIKSNKTQFERNVLNDTTNSLLPGLSRNNIFHKIITVPQPSATLNNNNTDHENHIPVYKSACSLKTPNIVESIPEKNKAVYEFEVDENEEPILKKKRKKRTYTKKPKTGPKALTINNIKYSSTESLASLPEKPIRKKRNTFVRPKCNIKPCSSVATLNGSCVSVPSFMSHPNLPLRDNVCELSVLQETQSEQCPTLESTLLEAPVPQSPSSSSGVPVTPSHSHHSHFSTNPRCYGSKSGQTPNPYNDDQNIINCFLSQQASSSATNISSSSHDFLSSTPCKRFSLVVRENSVFDDSPGMRPNSGLIQDTSSLMTEDDNCFGFDEPEELEEPLVSPIKNGIDLQPMRILKYVPKRHDCEEPKPSIQEVIELLKANIPKPAVKKDTTLFVTSPHLSEPTSPTVVETDSPVFVKVL